MRLEGALLLAVLLASPAAGAEAPVALEFREAPGCAVPAGLPCVAGHDPGAGPGLGDDTVSAYAVVRRASVHGPTGGLGALVLDADETHVDHPVFAWAEAAWALGAAALPPEVARVVRLRNGTTANGLEGMWITLHPGEVLALGGLGHLFVPVWFYVPHTVERDRLYPLGNGGRSPPATSDDALLMAAFALGTCPWVETAATTAACDARSPLVWSFERMAREALPAVNVTWGLTHAEVATGPPPGPSAARPAGGAPSGATTAPAVAGQVVGPVELRQAAALPGGVEAFPPLVGAAVGEPRPEPPAPPVGPAAAVHEDLPWIGVALGGAALVVAAVLYRRLRPADLLAHPARRAMLDRVAARPGTNVLQLAGAMGLSYKSALHHAELLLEGGYLTVHLRGRERMLFPASREFPLARRQDAVVLQRPSVVAVLAVMDRLGPVPRARLPALAGLSRTAAWAAVRDLQARGLLAVEGRGRGAVVRVVPAPPPPPAA